KGKMEMEKVPQAGYAIQGLTIAGFNRTHLLKNLTLPFKLMKSFWEVKQIFKSFKPHAVIGVGGYSSFPVLKYAQAKNIPTFIHESNSYAGKSNQFLGKKASKIFVAVEGMEQFFPKEKLFISGNPVRKNIVEKHATTVEAKQFFNLQPYKTTVLVIGGSLGARSINEAIANNIAFFINNNCQLIWQTGKTDAARFKAAANNKSNIWVNEFIQQMDMAYAAADVVISRSGAMSVSELCVASKPVIFVPYPYAAEDHQTVNAQYLVNKEAALLVKDSEVPQKLIPTLEKLITNKALQATLSINIGKQAITKADTVIAQEILNYLAL
ncbi:MAG: undecaprenyldiphospho-muramoylpentapeptide beta-N-acetylglucosaminyltransferase, partial [Chitinophagaceae bacterium]